MLVKLGHGGSDHWLQASFVGGWRIVKVLCSVELGRKGDLTEWDLLWYNEGLPVTWL